MTLMRPGIRRGSETMVDLVRRHAESRPERIAHAFMAEQESAPIEQLDYQELVRRADTVAAALDRWFAARPELPRSEEHTSELQSLMRISYAVICLQKKKKQTDMFIIHTINTT